MTERYEMEPNPSQPPMLPVPPSPQQQSIVGPILKMGLAVYGVGAAAMVAYFVGAFFLMSAGAPKLPVWLLGIAFFAVTLLPLGLTLLGAGALVWMLSKRKKS
jgi:hypothetical protein